jgi:hypothetical protein
VRALRGVRSLRVLRVLRMQRVPGVLRVQRLPGVLRVLRVLRVDRLPARRWVAREFWGGVRRSWRGSCCRRRFLWGGGF